MRRDRPGNTGAMDMRPLAVAERVKTFDDRIGKLRMARVDSGINDCNSDIGAVGERMRLGKA